MSLYQQIINVIRTYENDICFDTEAHHYHYCIQYENNIINLYEIDEYYSNGDEWGEINIKERKELIQQFEANINDFCNFIIKLYNDKILYIIHEYPENNDILKKIEIKEIR